MLTLSDVRKVNRRLRKIDNSNLWPIRGRFNVTERAIRRVRQLRRDGLGIDSRVEYHQVVENEIGQIVNDERNW